MRDAYSNDSFPDMSYFGFSISTKNSPFRPAVCETPLDTLLGKVRLIAKLGSQLNH